MKTPLKTSLKTPWLLLARTRLGDTRLFTTISIAISAVRLLQRISGTGPKSLYTHKLKPGEVIVVTEVDKTRKK